MIPGLSIQIVLAVHVAISLVGIVSGLVALPALAAGRWLRFWQVLFLTSTAATSLTGYLFPFNGLTPAMVVGAISLVILAVSFVALFGLALRGWARIAYALSATAALYLNLFVLVVQSFLKIPALQALAPTQTEPAFVAAQGVVLVASAGLGVLSVIGSRRVAMA